MNFLLNWDKRWLISWNNFAESSGFTQALVKYSAEYLIYLLPIVLIGLWLYSAQAKKVALRALFSAGLAAAMAMIIGQSIDRARPFEVTSAKEILFHRPTYSFPSDHASVLFAVALSFYLFGYKKLSYFVFILAIIIGATRIAAGVHYPSDILAGLVVGIIAAYIIKALDGPLSYLYNWIISVAKKVRLA